MNKVLLGQSYFLRFDPKLWQAMQPFPPLGTLYAASYLRSSGYQVALFDAMLAESEEEWAQALDREQPRFAVLFEDNFNYLSKMCLLRMRQAAFMMLEMARQRGVIAIACGADASDHAAEYLDHGASFIIRGEGEQTLGELLDQQTGKTGTSPNEVLGLVYRSEAGDLLSTPRRPDLRDLDSLPFPAWDLVDIPRYRDIWTQQHGYFSLNMVTTRGCPFHCNWCAKPIWGQRYNTRSPENVAAEMEWLRDQYHPDQIWFMDDIFGLKPGWIESFADALEKKHVHIPFKSLNRADLLLKGQTIPALKRAGAQIIWIGAESGSQKILDAMEKGTRVEQIGKAALQLHRAGIQVGFFLQFGYPGETLEDIEKTLQMVRDCRPDDIGISVSYPLPGTRFYEAVRDQLGAKQNWDDSQDLAMLYQGPFSTEFYRKLHERVHQEFRMRRTWDELRTTVRTRGIVKSGLFRRSAAMLYQWITLPVTRLQLARLAKLSPKGQFHLQPALSQQAAASPTPQSIQGGKP
jgi:anaerobic magnesium-protoporphyrin IX monomethyl ester cyclase